MKRDLTIFLVIVATLAIAMPITHGKLWDKPYESRPAHVSGQFYPDNPMALALVVDKAIAKESNSTKDGKLFALIVPHAGYPYSSAIAAKSYAQLKGRKFSRVVVIAPSHFDSFPYASVYNGDAFTTPLGDIPVDKSFAGRLVKKNAHIKLSSTGHGCVMGRCEHALEVQLPFLQKALGNFKLVPIVMGKQNYTIERALGVALAELIKEENGSRQPETLIVASSDLSHYHPYEQAIALDQKVTNAIKENDYFSLSVNAEQGTWEACGGGAIVAAMIAAERLGANDNVILGYTNSGDVTGDKSGVVGYAAAAIVKSENRTDDRSQTIFSLLPSDKEILLSLAKNTVENAVRYNKIPPLPEKLSEALTNARGAFVTLKKHGQLRGCIGYVTPSYPLIETVRHVAALAAMKDPRFPSVSVKELGELEYEVSVLSSLHRVTDMKDIKIGRDGLIVRKGDDQGLLLPQVPVEQGWDVPAFLEQTSIKAGLSPKAWKSQDADVFVFSAVVFGDDMKGQ